MCITTVVHFSACNHTSPGTSTTTEPCLLALLVDKPCTAASNRLATQAITSKQSTYCESCYQQGLNFIDADYRRNKNIMIFEAWALGWRIGDVKGSLDDLGAEEREVREEWIACCARSQCLEESPDGLDTQAVKEDGSEDDLSWIRKGAEKELHFEHVGRLIREALKSRSRKNASLRRIRNGR